MTRHHTTYKEMIIPFSGFPIISPATQCRTKAPLLLEMFVGAKIPAEVRAKPYAGTTPTVPYRRHEIDLVVPGKGFRKSNIPTILGLRRGRAVLESH